MKNTFILGLILAVSVVATDALQSFITSNAFDWAAVGVAAGIAIIGYLGKYFSGSTNTNLALLGSALGAIVPLITTGTIDWKLIAATFLVKIIGLLTDKFKAATRTDTEPH